MTTKPAYQEPTGEEFAGLLRYKVGASAYEVFMEEQNIPIYQGWGMYDVRQLPLAPWQRMGGQGSFIELDGQAGSWGMYAVEVPAGGMLNAERHMYEEIFIVIEGHGSTEVWREGNPKKQIFEWQPGGHFAIPLNTWHRLVNATSSPALVLVATSAPLSINSFQSRSFIFDNTMEFPERYDESDDYFKPRDELETIPQRGRAMLRTNLIADLANCYLPLDNTRAPGYKIAFLQMAASMFYGWISEYPSGRYSKAHHHQSGAVLICMKGKGYTHTWPAELGQRPWETGNGHLVKRQDYIPGGIVSAAPGSGDWFHQHFSVGKDCLRIRMFSGLSQRLLSAGGGRGGEEVAGAGLEIGQGGIVLGYPEEDPQVRKDYKETLEREGVEFQMPESIYHR